MRQRHTSTYTPHTPEQAAVSATGTDPARQQEQEQEQERVEEAELQGTERGLAWERVEEAEGLEHVRVRAAAAWAVLMWMWVSARRML
jgi:hypothetical protein